jgi:GntR family transcriptional regulator
MTDSSVWEQIVVDRRDRTAPYLQIAYVIRHRIATNQIAPSTVLPSVRSLADRIGVTPATVARAYRQLSHEGLVEGQVGMGTVVRETDRLLFDGARRSTGALDQAIDDALTPLIKLGYAPVELRDAVDRRLQRASAGRVAIVVSDAHLIVEKYVAIMRAELGPIGVQVDGMVIDDLHRDDPSVRARLGRAHRVLTSLGLYRRVRDALDRCQVATPISVILTELNLATIERLTSIPKGTRTLLVAEERYRGSILGILREYVAHDHLEVLHTLDEGALAAALRDRDLVVHSLGMGELVRSHVTGHHDLILMDYQVRPDFMARLRASFDSDTHHALT